jgi:hypothetical protein
MATMPSKHPVVREFCPAQVRTGYPGHTPNFRFPFRRSTP